MRILNLSDIKNKQNIHESLLVLLFLIKFNEHNLKI